MESRAMQRQSQIGLDRLVRLNWLEKTAALAVEGIDVREAKQKLKEEIKDSFRSKNPDIRGSIDKTVTILAKTWLMPPPDLKEFRDSGINFLRTIRGSESLVIHWGMILAAYPFWGAVADQVGRLLRLQDSVSASQIQRRLKETLGERETVSRRARYVIRSFLDWGVIRASNTKGIYQAAMPLEIKDPKLLAWIFESCLHTQGNRRSPLMNLVNNPGLFPFKLSHSSVGSILAANERLDALKHGLDDVLIQIKN